MFVALNSLVTFKMLVFTILLFDSFRPLRTTFFFALSLQINLTSSQNEQNIFPNDQIAKTNLDQTDLFDRCKISFSFHFYAFKRIFDSLYSRFSLLSLLTQVIKDHNFEENVPRFLFVSFLHYRLNTSKCR